MMVTSLQKQRGASIIIAVFVILIITMLGATMVSVLNQGAESVAREVISTRAYFAAESGAERMLNRVFAEPNDCDPQIITSWNSASGSPNDCVITTSCDRADDVGNSAIPVYNIVANAQCGSGDIFAHRSVQVHATD